MPEAGVQGTVAAAASTSCSSRSSSEAADAPAGTSAHAAAPAPAAPAAVALLALAPAAAACPGAAGWLLPCDAFSCWDAVLAALARASFDVTAPAAAPGLLDLLTTLVSAEACTGCVASAACEVRPAAVAPAAASAAGCVDAAGAACSLLLLLLTSSGCAMYMAVCELAIHALKAGRGNCTTTVP